MSVRVGTGRVVALVLQMMDVAEDGLEDQEDDYHDAEDWVEGADLGGRTQSVSQPALGDIQRNVGLTSAAPSFAM